MAAGRARRLRLRGFQQLAAYRDTYAARRARRMERLLPGGDVPRPAPPRVALQAPRPRRQRLAGPHSGLRRARGTGRGDEELHGPVLGAGAVRLAGRRVRRLEERQPHDLRGPCGHGAGEGGRGHLPRIHGKNTTYNKKGRLQRRAAHGHRRAPLLRVVRLSCVEFLRPGIALRHARRAEGAGAPRPRAGAGSHHGPRTRPLREEPQRRHQRAGRHRPALFAARKGGLPALLGLDALRLRQGRGAAFPAFERQILARRIPFRRLPLRRRDLDDLPPPRLHRFRLPRTFLRRGGERRRADLSDAGQPAGARLPRGRRDDRRGRKRHAGDVHSRHGRRHRLRLPAGDGHSRFLDQAAQGGARRGVEHLGDVERDDRPPARSEDGGLRRVARSGAGGRQDTGVQTDGQGYVFQHGPRVAERGDRPRHGAAQDDPPDDHFDGRAGLPQLHGQRVRASRMDRLPARGQRLELRPRPAAVVAGRERVSALCVAGGFRQGDD